MKETMTNNYSQIKKVKPKKIRGYIRDFVLDGLSTMIKLPNAKKELDRPRVQFLYIHHVFDDEIEKFDKLLNELSKHHTFISYSEAINRITTKNIDKAYISISSDDGFKNNLNAAKILDRYDIKGCFFINPDSIGMKDYQKINSFCKERLNFPPTEFMDWNDVDNLLKSGHEIGSHTIGHINIAETSIKEIEINLSKSYEIISKNCGNVFHFAYPYGRFFHFNQEALRLVYKTGYISCASAERGCHIAPQNTLTPQNLFIRRDHVVCDWNINHIMYFILNNSKKASLQTNLNPYK